MPSVVDTWTQTHIWMCKQKQFQETKCVLATGQHKPGFKRFVCEIGGHLELTKFWEKSFSLQMGYVKRKHLNAGKVAIIHTYVCMF